MLVSASAVFRQELPVGRRPYKTVQHFLHTLRCRCLLTAVSEFTDVLPPNSRLDTKKTWVLSAVCVSSLLSLYLAHLFDLSLHDVTCKVD